MADVGIVSPFFYPEEISTGRYNTELARALARNRLTVSVVSSYPFYPEWKPRNDRRSPDTSIRVVRGGLWIRYPRNQILKRSILEAWFALHVLLHALQLRSVKRLVIAVYPPSAYTFLLKAAIGNATPVCGIVHDLQAVFANKQTSWAHVVVHRIVRWIEGAALRSCDRLIFLSKAMQRRAIEEYSLDAARTAICYPFVTLGESDSTGDTLSDEFSLGRLHVVYSGALGEKQNGPQLLRFYEALIRERSDVCCHVFSAGPKFDELKREYEARDIARILFHPLVSEDQLVELYARSHVHVVPQAPGTSDGSMPSKLPNLLAAGVPVFAITDGKNELTDILEQTAMGEACITWNVDNLTTAMIELLERAARETHNQRSARTSAFVQRHFSLQNLVDQVMQTVAKAT